MSTVIDERHVGDRSLIAGETRSLKTLTKCVNRHTHAFGELAVCYTAKSGPLPLGEDLLTTYLGTPHQPSGHFTSVVTGQYTRPIKVAMRGMT